MMDNPTTTDSINKKTECHFPEIPRKTPEVKSLLEISEKMAPLPIEPMPKRTNNLGPWISDDKWMPRNVGKRSSGHQRSTLSKRKWHSADFIKFPKMYNRQKENSGDKITETVYPNSGHLTKQSSEDVFDPYFKQESYQTDLTHSREPPDIEAAVVSTNLDPTTPSLPTLITLQSPKNKNDFNATFSLGKVDLCNPDMTSLLVPRLIYSNKHRRQSSTSPLLVETQNTGNINNRYNTTSSPYTFDQFHKRRQANDGSIKSNFGENDFSRVFKENNGQTSKTECLKFPETFNKPYVREKQDQEIAENCSEDKLDYDYARDVNSCPDAVEPAVDIVRIINTETIYTLTQLSIQPNKMNKLQSNPCWKEMKDQKSMYNNPRELNDAHARSNTFGKMKVDDRKINANNDADIIINRENYSLANNLNHYPWFDQLTHPPDNPKVLKILGQRRPAPPVLEFQDTSTHMRHYRMFHTVQFTGRFSLANQPPKIQEPVQWNEVFPNRPLSSAPATTVPAYRLREEMLETRGGNLILQTRIPETQRLNADIKAAESKEHFQVYENEEFRLQSNLKSPTYERQSTPFVKEKLATLDLTPTVTPISKFKPILETEDIYQRSNVSSENSHGVVRLNEKESLVKTDHNQTAGPSQDIDLSFGAMDKKDVERIRKPSHVSKVLRRAKKRIERMREKLKEPNRFIIRIPGCNEEDECDPDNAEKTEDNQIMISQDHENRRNQAKSAGTGISERDRNEALFSYKELMKRSTSSMSREKKNGENIRPRNSRESLAGRRWSNQSPSTLYVTKHPYSILDPDYNMTFPSRRHVIIDENRLKTSIDEKINESNQRLQSMFQNTSRNGSSFIQFLAKRRKFREQLKNKINQESTEGVNRDNDIIECKEDNREEGKTHFRRISSVNVYDVNDNYGLNHENEEDASPTQRDESINYSKGLQRSKSYDKKIWCPKSSQLNVSSSEIENKSRSDFENWLPLPFRDKSLTKQAKNSAFVIAAPPLSKGFDNRSVVLPLNEYVDSSMRSNNTFSELSNFFNSGPNINNTSGMLHRHARSRNTRDDGLIRIVTFASPVSQFIFAKRITGFASGISNLSEPKRQSKGGRKWGSYRLCLKDGEMDAKDGGCSVNKSINTCNLNAEVSVANNKDEENITEKSLIEQNDEKRSEFDIISSIAGSRIPPVMKESIKETHKQNLDKWLLQSDTGKTSYLRRKIVKMAVEKSSTNPNMK